MADRRRGGRAPDRGRAARGDGSSGRRQRRRTSKEVPGVRRELARRSRNPERDERRLQDAADAFARERFKDARRILEPIRQQHPDAASVLELSGLIQYRLGQWAKARAELERFTTLTGTTEQHPVLMDCSRAQGDYENVERLWDELRRVSPSGALVTEGRIVLAGALADQDRLEDALRLLQRGPVEPKHVKPHHLRLWYALADLEERAGNLPRARSLFERIRRQDATFADVAERLAGLGG